MNNQTVSVANYLNALPDIKNARPCRVTIGKTAYVGARYTSIGRYQAGMQAVTEGSKKAGDEYESDRFYLLMDKLPPSYFRRPKPVYVMDGKEWYLSSYYDQEGNEQHPYGKTFSLQAWDLPGEKIDQHDRKPRLRMQVTVEYLDATEERPACEQPPMPTVGTVADVSQAGEMPQKASA